MVTALAEHSIADLQVQFDGDAWSSAALCEAFLRRIAEIDRAGPRLRAVIETNPDALDIAAALDRERQGRGPRGPLHGVPILVKDNIDSGDAMATTAGSLALEGNIAPRDACVVAKLRAAGAVVLGKTNMSEWAFFRSSRGCSGWSSRGGQVRNPHILDRTPSGSSSGSAAAVAATLCTAALGTETDGSVVSPSAMNGIVGLKPTVGLVSRSGVIPISETQDTVGPMARSVADLAALLGVLAGPDPDDPVTQEGVGKAAADYCVFLDAGSLKGARLGVARDYFGRHEGTDAVIERAIATLRELGAVIVDPVSCGVAATFDRPELEILRYEFKDGLNRYLAAHPQARIKSLAELIRFNEEHAEVVMPFFGQEELEESEARGTLSDQAYLDAKAFCRRQARDEGIDKALRTAGLDAIVAPTKSTPAWTIDPVVGDRNLGGCAGPAAMAGYPHITVPAGAVKGLPVGLSFFAGPYQEGKLIGYAHAFEQATQARPVPTFRASVTD